MDARFDEGASAANNDFAVLDVTDNNHSLGKRVMKVFGMRRFLRSVLLGMLGSCCLVSAPAVHADGSGWYTAPQVAPGRWEYSQKCAVCHGAQLQGGGAPALKGTAFTQRWDGKKLSDLYGFIHGDMPLGLGASLPSQEYADIVGFLLAQSGLPAGTDKFTPYSPMDRVLELSAAAAAGGTVASAPPGQVSIGALYGKLAQPTTSAPTQAELDAADAATDNWLMYNKGYRGERYSTLADIHTRNAANLRPVCMYQLGELGTFETGPVMYDGVVYATTHLGTYAPDLPTAGEAMIQPANGPAGPVQWIPGAERSLGG
jgi:alcohol dehydrogenase (cytochrome c)